MPILFARVAVENTAYHFDKAFDYLIPEELLEQAKPGCRVLVPFGAGNAQRLAMILEVSPEKETQNTTKQVVAVLDEAPLLTNEAIQLVFWLKDRYFCTLFEAVKLLLPAGIHYRMKTEYALAKGRPVEKEALSKEESALIEYLAGKLVRLRIFDDEAGVMNLDVVQTDGEILVVSQFTLQASTRKGNRPSYIKAAPEAVSRPLYERFTARVAELLGRGVATGEFGADMQVELVNDGPVTIWMDSKNKE